jgi:hypothetical protein
MSIPMSAMTYVQVHELVKTGRVAALKTDTRGRFCFKNLKAGNYMLRANVSGNFSGGGLSGYSTMDVFVTLAPKTKKGANRDLEITFGMAI